MGWARSRPVTMAPICSLTFAIFMDCTGTVDAAALIILAPSILELELRQMHVASRIPGNNSRSQDRPNVCIYQEGGRARRGTRFVEPENGPSLGRDSSKRVA